MGTSFSQLFDSNNYFTMQVTQRSPQLWMTAGRFMQALTAMAFVVTDGIALWERLHQDCYVQHSSHMSRREREREREREWEWEWEGERKRPTQCLALLAFAAQLRNLDRINWFIQFLQAVEQENEAKITFPWVKEFCWSSEYCSI
jgi:hypothetical protein